MATQQAVQPITNQNLTAEAGNVITKHVWSAMGVALLPLPLLDYVAFTGIQMNLVRRLAKMYGVTFFKDKVKNILAPLIGAAIPGTVGIPLTMSLMKAIPVMGQTFGVITMPIVAGATTYAVGKVFQQHFASGGTFLTFNPDKVKAYYAEMFQEGQKVAATMKG